MPELPEVEAIRHYLTSNNVIGARLQAFNAGVGVVQTDTVSNDICGSTITRIDRRGKYIIIGMEKPDAREFRLIMHMVMTGSLHLRTPNQLARLRHIRATIELQDGSCILLNDPRRWAKVWIVAHKDSAPTDNLGPELSDISPPDFAAMVRQRRQLIKPALLDQKLVAGIGNIYADEALHKARITPTRRASNISTQRLHTLHSAICDVFQHATRYIIDHPAPDGSPYVVDAHDARFLLQRRGRGSCPNCNESLTRTRIAGRTTIYCQTCQK